MRRGRTDMKGKVLITAKECAYIAVFTALLIASQYVLSAIPNVEVVTTLFICYAFVFGARRAMVSATAFSLLRQLVFGFFPTVLILYLVFYNGLALAFGTLSKTRLKGVKLLVVTVLLACVCTACFTVLDNIITPVWYGYSAKATKLYFTASLPVMVTHIISCGVGVCLLFLPLTRAFSLVKTRL